LVGNLHNCYAEETITESRKRSISSRADFSEEDRVFVKLLERFRKALQLFGTKKNDHAL